MGVVGSSGVTQVSGEVQTAGAVATPGTGQTVFNLLVTGTGSAQVAYTVIADKRLLLYAVNFTASSAKNVIMYKQDGSTNILSLVNVANENGQFISPVPFQEYATTEEVKVNITSGQKVNLIGILEDV